MKKILLISMSVIFGLGVLYVGINQLDAAAARMDIDGVDSSSLQALADSLFEPPNFDASNGYYRLFTLTEPVGTDIESSAVLLKYRRLNDPKYDNDKFIREWNKSEESWKARMDFKGNYRVFHDKRKKIINKSKDNWDSFPKNPSEDWCRNVAANRKYVEELQELLKVHLGRYEKMVKNDVFQDFTKVSFKSPVPNLLAWLHMSKLYCNINMLAALDGHWETAVENMLIQIRQNKMALKSSRTLILNLVAKANIRLSLSALDSIMNQPGCPESVYDLVINGLTPLKYEEYGSRNPILLEGFVSSQINDNGLFMQKNRTTQYYYDYFVRLVKCEETPPYRWKSHPMDDDVNSGWFWWVQNPTGKKKFEKAIKSKVFGNLFTVVYKSYWMRCQYEMTRIAAEVHKEFRANPKRKVGDILNGLDIYKNWVDPCSGKPYIWDEQRQLLYGFGIDCDDDGGKVNTASLDTDYAIQITPFIR